HNLKIDYSLNLQIKNFILYHKLNNTFKIDDL
ncbi:unnamed protein product, partial [marine sediment metagenome]